MDDNFDALVDDALYASRAFVALAVRTMPPSSTLTIPQHRVLLELAARGPQSLTSLSSHMRMPHSGTSRLCDRLISKGLMRKRVSPTSARSIELSVTDEGIAAIATVLGARRDELAEALSKVSTEEREALRDALSVIGATLDEPRALIDLAE